MGHFPYRLALQRSVERVIIMDSSNPATIPSTQQSQPGKPYEAIIFVPSIGEQWSDQSLEGMARKIATQLDLVAADILLEYVTFLRAEDIGTQSRPEKVKVCTIAKCKSGQSDVVPVIDL